MGAFNSHGINDSLARLAQHANLQQERRRAQADTLFSQAESWLEAAENSDYRDQQAVKAACKAYFQALKQNPAHLQACLRLSHLFFVYGKMDLALKYLSMARNIRPDYPDLDSLLSRYQDHLDEAARAATPKVQDPDLQFEEIEAWISEQLSTLMQDEALRGPPLCDPDALSRLQNQLMFWRERLRHMQLKVDELSFVTDVSLLMRKLNPIERGIGVLEARVNASKQFLHLLARMEDIQAGTREQLGSMRQPEARQQLAVLEDNLEALLDHFDLVADGLDELESRQLDIRPLYRLYKELLVQLDFLRDSIDDLHEAMN